MESISVIIPMYNVELTIVDALESIRKQNYKCDLEIIIVNDGSSDASCEVATKYGLEHNYLNIKIVNKENGGVSSARNTGIKVAKGEFIALLDADDEWLESKLKTLMPYFKNIEIDCIGSGRNGIPLKVGFRKIKKLTRIMPIDLVFKCNPQTSTVIFRRSIIEKAGLYNESLKYVEDCEYWLRIAHSCRFYAIPDFLVITGHGKHDYGQSGLSGNLNGMHRGELCAIDSAYANDMVSVSVYYLAMFFAKIKYIRRIVIVLLRKALL